VAAGAGWRMTLARIVLVVVLTHSVFVAARMTGSLYALANKASTFTVGVLIALFALVPMLLAVRAGRWLDAVGPRKPLIAGVSLIVAGAAMPTLFSYTDADIAPLLVSSCLIGTGTMLTQLTLQQLFGAGANPEKLAADFAWFALGASIAGFAGPVVSGFLIDRVGHRATFGVLLLVSLAAAAVVLMQRQRLATRAHEGGSTAPRDPFALLKIREVRNLLITVSLISMAWDLQNFMVPVHGTRVGLNATDVGLVLGSFAVATFTVRLAMPWLTRHFSEWQVLTYTLLTAACALFLMPLFDHLAPLAGVAFLLGLGLGAAQPNVMSLVHSRAPEGRVGEVLGVRTTMMNGSHVALPLVFGAFGTIIGATAVFWIMATLLATGGIAVLRLHRLGTI